MPLNTGTRLGAYEILDALGAGGMGEVYRARDARLGREVAIKILPEAFAADPDRRMRFEREARTLASLNHANIAAIYGLEDRALVMELVEGEDLSARIARGAMPASDALPIARQIADALEAAHEAGVIHRDLKPANIKVRPDGTVKVLDFGLAKAMDAGAQASASHDTAPTVTSPAMTAMGLILGTAAYMSPEQAKGRPVDRRADVWAFGVVLFEMLAGRRLFDAEDMSETLAAVLTRDVTLSAMPAGIPGPLRALVADCLVRDPKKRLRDIGDARLRIERIEAGGAAADMPPAAAPKTPRQRWLWPGIAAVSLIGALGMTVLHLNRPAPVAADLITFEISTQSASALAALSPDGRHVAYTTSPSGDAPSRLWVRSLSTLEARPIPSADGTTGRTAGLLNLGLVWSPDSRFAIFVKSSALHRVDIATGETRELLKAPRSAIAPGAWSRDGVILFGQRSAVDAGAAGIWRVADTGVETPAPVTALRPGEVWQRPSGFLPDGRHFLYAAYSTSLNGDADIRIGSIDRAPGEQDTRSLLSADSPAVYAPALDPGGAPLSTGYLLFVRQHNLMAQAFDPARAALTTTSPVQLASGAGAIVEVSDNGRLLYRRSDGGDEPLSELVRFDRKGTLLGKIGTPAAYGGIDVVEDGRLMIVRTDASELQHIYIVDPVRGAFSRLNPGPLSDYAPAPAPDGTVTFTFSPEGPARDLYIRAANGVGEPRLLVKSDNVKHANGWSPDGRFLIYDEHDSQRQQDLMIVRKEGGTAMPFLVTEFDETFGQFSPDGKWLAYRTTESGRPEVFVRDFAPDRTPAYGTEKVPISTAGGDKPRWSRDGRELFFLQGNTLMSVSIGPGVPLKVGAPVRLFDAKPTSYMPFDVMPDGSFVFVYLTESLTPTTTTMRVLLNWQAAIKR